MIELKNVKKYFHPRRGIFSSDGDSVKAVDGVSFTVPRGKTFGLVGESGCGKSTIAKLIVGILEPDSGEIKCQGNTDIVFQDPFSSLNPRMTIGDIVGEPLFISGQKRNEIKAGVKRMLSVVKLRSAECIDKYPHQFSGGERQRIAIARSLVRKPHILVLDEPVSSLDVSIQAGILNLLKDIQEEMYLTYVFITHDLRVAEFMSDAMGVMKEGTLVEVASPREIYSSPKDGYTRQLLDSIPKL